ncbi:hypothetical protein ElyMa_006902100 [Elysia marginata]|uniref:Uncharacterized protein n=1 Tax=Elysia marginata TaxID=1093978 RepID=A0AAV4JF87_9GAST|nr:hypothetical protein ElyMa_006902100 [Elysia marginata]
MPAGLLLMINLFEYRGRESEKEDVHQENANVRNNFFQSFFTREDENPLSVPENHFRDPVEDFGITVVIVKKDLKNVYPNKPTGLDRILAKLVHILAINVYALLSPLLKSSSVSQGSPAYAHL